MKKVQIYYYHGKNEKLEELTGYTHLEEYPAMNLSMINIIIENVFSKGLNVMLCHGDEDSAILYIDNGRFRQR